MLVRWVEAMAPVKPFSLETLTWLRQGRLLKLATDLTSTNISLSKLFLPTLVFLHQMNLRPIQKGNIEI